MCLYVDVTSAITWVKSHKMANQHLGKQETVSMQYVLVSDQINQSHGLSKLPHHSSLWWLSTLYKCTFLPSSPTIKCPKLFLQHQQVDIKFMLVIFEVKRTSDCKIHSLQIILQNTQQCAVLIPSDSARAKRVQEGQSVNLFTGNVLCKNTELSGVTGLRLLVL